MAFDPRAHLRSMKGQDYLDCKWRVLWFREENPDGQIETRMVFHDPDADGGRVIFQAAVRVPSTGASATGYCEGTHRDFKFGYIEKAETQAIGRALALLGYGTQFSVELDIDEGDKLSDSPIPRAETARMRDAVEERKSLAAEITQHMGRQLTLKDYRDLAAEYSLPIPSSQGDLTVGFLSGLRDALKGGVR